MQPTPPIQTAQLLCTGCGYDLAGTPVGGICPECGLSVGETIRALRVPPARHEGSDGLLIAIVSIFCAGFILAPIALIMGINARSRARTAGRPAGTALAAIIIASIVIAMHLVSLVYLSF